MFLGRSPAFLAAAALTASAGAFSPASPRTIAPKKTQHKFTVLTSLSPPFSSSRLTSRLFQRYDDDAPYGQSGGRSDSRRWNFADLGRKGGGGGKDRSKDWFRYYEDRAEDRQRSPRYEPQGEERDRGRDGDGYYEDRAEDRRRAPRYEPQDEERYRSRNRSDYANDTENDRPREDERYDNGRYIDRGRANDYPQRPGQQQGQQRYADESRYDGGRRGMDRQERDDYGYYRQEGRGQRYGQDGEDRYDQRSEYDQRYSGGYDSMDSRERSYNRDYDYVDDRRRDFDYREPRGELMRRTRNENDRYNTGYYSNYDRRGGDLARRRRYSDDPYLPIPRFPSSPFFSSMFDPFASLDAMMGRMMGPMTRRASRLQFQMNDMARDDAGDLIDEALDILDRDRIIRTMMRSGDPPIRLASSNRAIFSRSSSMTLVDGVQKELLKIGAKLNYPWTMWLVAENGRLKSLVVIDKNDREIDVPVRNRGDRDDDVVDAEVLYD
jgi:hypothetical protein